MLFSIWLATTFNHSMRYSIEVYFDAESERMIRRIWRSLHDAGIETIIEQADGRPHMSIAVFEQVDPQILQPVLQDFAQHLANMSLRFSSVGSFPGLPGVVFLAPLITRLLLRRHMDLHDQLAQIDGQQRTLYQPDNWVPHCTLAYNLPETQVPQAVEIARRLPWPSAVRISELGLTAVQEVDGAIALETIYRFRM